MAATAFKASVRFAELKARIGQARAIYCFCAVFDVPFNYDIAASSPSWNIYRTKIDGAGSIFDDGDTEMSSVLNAGRKDNDIERWKREWGTGDEENPYTTADYQRLDALFRTFSARLEKAGGMDEQQEYTIRSCCQNALLAEKCRQRGKKEDIDMYARLNKIIQDDLSSEQLRRKDAKPVEAAQIEGIVEALGKRGLPIDCTIEQAQRFCAKWMAEMGFPMTTDAAEHILKCIIDTIMQNNDMPPLEELPESMRFGDGLETQFASTPNEKEKEVYKYLGYVRGDNKGNIATETPTSQPKQKTEAAPITTNIQSAMEGGVE